MRDIQKEESEGDSRVNGHDHREVWRRDTDAESDLQKLRQELSRATERALEAERRREMLETQMRQAEERLREAELELERLMKERRYDADKKEEEKKLTVLDF